MLDIGWVCRRDLLDALLGDGGESLLGGVEGRRMMRGRVEVEGESDVGEAHKVPSLEADRDRQRRTVREEDVDEVERRRRTGLPPELSSISLKA